MATAAAVRLAELRLDRRTLVLGADPHVPGALAMAHAIRGIETQCLEAEVLALPWLTQRSARGEIRRAALGAQVPHLLDTRLRLRHRPSWLAWQHSM